jgi:hydroxylamine reductase
MSICQHRCHIAIQQQRSDRTSQEVDPGSTQEGKHMTTFCYQCEQTAKGTGCVETGNCGKDQETSLLQDLVVHATKGIAMYAHRAAQLGNHDDTLGRTVIEALFGTVTNVNFDPARIEEEIQQLGSAIEKARDLYESACRRVGSKPQQLFGPAQFHPANARAALLEQAAVGSISGRITRLGADIAGLQELILYGLKGAAAYAEHAAVLGREDRAIYTAFYEILDVLAGEEAAVDKLLPLALKVGEVNFKVMELLDAANAGAYGHPTPTQVNVKARRGKAILVSGHDLRDLEELLKQSEGKGINIYTHGEMLPAHGYPELRKYKHLVGNWGGAWQDQTREFPSFPGAFLFTTNCIQRPKPSYIDRVFTSGLVEFPGVCHVKDRNCAPVIEAALASRGFDADEPEQRITVGFGHEAVLGVAGQIIDAVKSRAIRHFFLIGGCDGAKSGRNYYTEFAEKAPKDTVILTLACGKYRFNKLAFGDIGGIPRLLDIGQCNDSYSAIQIAVALAKAFNTDVNGLPLSMILSWYEQKAVAVLLTLLHLGIRNIRLGPTLPAFVTPTVLKVLVDKFAIKPIGTVDSDLKACLGN